MLNDAAAMEEDVDTSLLRVHSEDLHQHVVEKVGEFLDTSLFADLAFRCHDGEVVHAHRVVLATASPFIERLLTSHDSLGDDLVTMDVPDVSTEVAQLLIDVVYRGSVEATLSELRDLLLLARSLYITIPVSAELLQSLDLDLPPLPPLPPLTPKTPPKQQTLPTMPLPIAEMLTSMQTTPLKASSPPKLMPGGGGLAAIAAAASLKGNNGAPAPPPPLQRYKEEHSMMVPAALSADHESADAEEFVCQLCNSKYNNFGNFQQHMKFHENEQLRERRNFMMNELVATCYNPEISLYTCEICRSTYSHPGNFKQHLGKHERETGGVTALYNKRMGGGSDSDAHFVSAAIASAASKSSVAAVVAASANSNSNSHLSHALQSSFADKVDNGDAGGQAKQYVCPTCGRDFKHPGNFRQHMASHSRLTKTLPNNAGGMGAAAGARKPEFDSVAFAAKNLPPSVVLKRQHKCDICDIIFPTRDQLRQHKRTTHAPGAPVAARQALPPPAGGSPLAGGGGGSLLLNPSLGAAADLSLSPSTSSPAALSSANLYNCDVPSCFESFSKEGWLTRHKEKAHGIMEDVDKPFECEFCHKRFAKQAKFTAHRKIHSAPEIHYKFPCHVCGKKFTRQQHVKRHMLLHTGEKPFKCNKCHKCFNREDKLKNHWKQGCDMQHQGYAGHAESLNHDDIAEEEDDEDEEGMDEMDEGSMPMTMGHAMEEGDDEYGEYEEDDEVEEEGEMKIEIAQEMLADSN